MKPHHPLERPAEPRPATARPAAGVSRVADEPSAAGQVEWRAWMRDFGRRLRRTRDFLGLSQEEVAALAGVSQGAVSRLETAHGLATPLLIVLKVQRALARHLAMFDPALLGPEMLRSVELVAALGMPSDGDVQIARDAALDELVQAYRDLPERHRDTLLAVVRATVGGLKASGT